MRRAAVWGQGGEAIRWTWSGGITVKLSQANARSLSLKFENAHLVSNVGPSFGGIGETQRNKTTRPDNAIKA